jgi:hypothetical protein
MKSRADVIMTAATFMPIIASVAAPHARQLRLTKTRTRGLADWPTRPAA